MTEYGIRSLSLIRHHLDVLYCISTARQMQQTSVLVELPQYMWWLWHAIETTRGTCVVAHYGPNIKEVQQ